MKSADKEQQQQQQRKQQQQQQQQQQCVNVEQQRKVKVRQQQCIRQQTVVDDEQQYCPDQQQNQWQQQQRNVEEQPEEQHNSERRQQQPQREQQRGQQAFYRQQQYRQQHLFAVKQKQQPVVVVPPHKCVTVTASDPGGAIVGIGNGIGSSLSLSVAAASGSGGTTNSGGGGGGGSNSSSNSSGWLRRRNYTPPLASPLVGAPINFAAAGSGATAAASPPPTTGLVDEGQRSPPPNVGRLLVVVADTVAPSSASPSPSSAQQQKQQQQQPLTAGTGAAPPSLPLSARRCRVPKPLLTVPVASGAAIWSIQPAPPRLLSPLFLSTPVGDGVAGIGVNSPTVLLSPVLSRPVRSQSAHTPPFLIARSASACCSCAASGSAISDSEESESVVGSAQKQQQASISGDATALLTHQRKASSTRHQQCRCCAADGGRSGSGTPPSLNSLFRLKGPPHHGQLTSSSGRHHLSTSAQKLHSLPGSGSFSRSTTTTTNWQSGVTSGSGGYTNSSFFTASLAYHHSHPHTHSHHHHHNSNNNNASPRRGHPASTSAFNGSTKRPPLHHAASQCCGSNSLSHQDSLESSASGPAATSVHQPPSAFALPASAASAVFLQRSHSDAQELRHHCHNTATTTTNNNNNRRSGSRTPQPPQRQSSTTCCPPSASSFSFSSVYAAGGPSPRKQPQQQQSPMSEQQWSRMRRIRRRPSTSLRAGISNADFLNNSSLDSNGGGVFSSTTTGGYFFPYSMLTNSSFNSSSLMRWKCCPLGHSDPQIYTLTPNGGGFLDSNTSPAVSATSQASPCSSTVSDTHRHSMASSCGSGRRSFLSASPLTTKFRKDSLLLTSPRASIAGSNSGGHTRRRLTETLHHSSPSPHHYSPGGTRTHHHGHHNHLGGIERHHAGRRSIGGDCTLSGASLSFSATRLRVRSSTGAAHSLLPHQPQPSTSSASAVLIRPRAHRATAQPSSGSGSNLPPPKADNRRWSLASLPSSSGYGTPGSNSAFSSQYSSQEHLAELMMDLRMNAQHHFDSNESYSCFEDAILGFRPRSRSLNSPVRSGMDFGAEASGHHIMSSVYKERFPKAKEQMESRLQQFLISNAPLSGFTTSTSVFLPPPTPSAAQQQSFRCASPNRNFTLPLSGSGSGSAASPQQCQSPTASGSRLSRHPSSSHHHHRSSSPRPTSPLPQRPISPLAMESATVIDGGAGGMVFRSISTSHYSAGNSGSFGGGNLSANAAVSPSGSSFNLCPLSGGNQEASVSASFSAFAAAAAAASFAGGGGNASTSSSTATTNNSGNLALGPSSGPGFNRSHRSSFMVAQPGETLTAGEQSLLRLICDGATRFLHHQICEICADCLQKSRDDLLTCVYFCSMSVRLDETLAEAEVKVGPESYKYLASLVRQILMIVSRTARLLECLEFNPDEFYHLLEEAEGAVRVQLGSGNARVPDLPQYIISKLGLNKNLLMDQVDQQTLQDEESDATTLLLQQQQQRDVSAAVEKSDSAGGLRKVDDHAQLGMTIARNAPSEEDFETIRLISNGAYGAVYLVRHKQTRQRFALKKMKKQTLILRNQVDQVYAERDILTFTDNPFVVCFYGSFETKQHLCMLMEYVEGGDCAALLKSAGTLPIELARLYVAETVLAIEYLHSCGIVHRDLKPDNLLITTMGHIKLTDFGLSKIGLMNRTTLVSEGYLLDDTQQFKDNQLCGTPEYIAPCVILRQGYGKPVDWWALGIILYEFLVGIVPFTGDTPEQLFANIINEEVEYPDGDEALDSNAESLIRLLLEKNPVDRLGTVGGAAEVAAHPFFASLDFDSLLRQKAEFVPQLENDEDTSYFDSREDRYNHDAESGDDDAVPMFWSFSTASPRHSIVGMDIPSGALAGLQALAESSGACGAGGSSGDASGSESQPPPRTSSAGRPPSTGTVELAESRQLYSSEDSSGVLTSSLFVTGSRASAFSAVTKQNNGNGNISADVPLGDVVGRLPPPASSGTRMGMDNNQPIPSAVILRRRFSTQRHANLSTSSSGTTTGTGPLNTCSSTDSSMDAAHFAAIGMDSAPPPSYGGAPPRRHNTVSAAPLPRFAISPCGSRNSDMAADVLPQHNRAPFLHGGGGVRRATVGGTEYFQQQRDAPQSFGGGVAGSASSGSNAGGVELSPVDETAGARREDSEQSLHRETVGEGIVAEANKEEGTALTAKTTTTRGAMEKRPSTVVHDLITSDTAAKATGGGITAVATIGGDTQPITRSTRSASCRSSTTAVSSNNNSLRVMIPPQHHHGHGSSLSGASSPQPGSGGSMSTSYYHSYGNTSGGGGSQLSPSCASVSSGSSFELSGNNIAESSTEGAYLRQGVGASGVSLPQRASISSTSPLLISSGGTTSSLLQPPATGVQQSTSSTIPAHHQQPSSSSSKTIVIRKGLQGYGFTIRSVRVYLSEASEYYTIEHIVAAVREPSPAHEAGLRVNDLITHIHTQSVHNLTHPQLMHRLLSCGSDLTLHVVPLQSTSIREGEARRNVGKLLRKRPRKPAAHTHRRAAAAAAAAAGLVVDKKGGRKASSSALLRRLSGKRTAGDIVPGSSSQKQTFMPRSVSSQDGALSVSPSVTKQQQQHQPPSQQRSQRYLTTDAAAAGAQHSATSDDSARQSTRRASSSAIAGKSSGSTAVASTSRSGTNAAAASLQRRPPTAVQKQQDVATQQSPPPRRPSATLMDVDNKIHQPVAQRPLTLNTNALASSGGSNNETMIKPCGGGGLAVSSASLPSSNATNASRTMPLSPLARQSSSASTSTTMTAATVVPSAASSSSEKSFGGAIFDTISNAMGFGGGGSTNNKTATIPPQAPRQQSTGTAAIRRVSSTKVPLSPPMGQQTQSASDTGTTSSANAGGTASSMIRRRTLAAADSTSTASTSSSSAGGRERPSTSIGNNKNNLQAGSNRSPSPSRKVSPSRIVQRLFRAASSTATGGASGASAPPSNATAPSPK